MTAWTILHQWVPFRAMSLSLGLALGAGLGMGAAPVWADFPVIEAAEATHLSGDRWRVQVTLSHPDSGWDHYADGWEVLDQDGTGLGFRELLHPHEHEQPFTRSLDLVIPAGTTRLYIRAQCNVDGMNYTEAYTIDLP